jgi:hypothetical protein
MTTRTDEEFGGDDDDANRVGLKRNLGYSGAVAANDATVATSERRNERLLTSARAITEEAGLHLLSLGKGARLGKAIHRRPAGNKRLFKYGTIFLFV